MSGRGVAALSTNQRVDPPPAPGPPFELTSAVNGLSVDTTSFQIILGQPLGAPGNPAALLFDTEIPLAGRRLQLFDQVAGSVFEFFGSFFSFTGASGGFNTVSTFGGENMGITSGAGLSQLSSHAMTLSVYLGSGTVIDNNTGAADPGVNNLLIQFERVGFGVPVPLARMDIQAGNGDIAPIGLAPSVAVQAPLQDDKVNYDGVNLYLSNNGTNFTIAKTLMQLSTIDFPNTAAGTSSDVAVAFTGAALGDVVCLGLPNAAVPANGVFMAWVSAADQVTVRFTNTNLVAALDPPSDAYRISIIKYV